ncbi:MAG: Cytochrome d ubiquinol oxidase subunit [Gemmataceae bacterium]|nr:Cytochrome d ubiquinol oxidase subunit [Gemmataceae bacterium]
MDLPTIWFVLIGFFLAGYAILDGFDLGVGILHLFGRGDAERHALVESIGPFWSGNEVWLVVFGGALFAAFPAAYAAAFTAMYVPFMVLLVALIFRAVAIEFRHHAYTPGGRLAWDVAFCLASVLTTFLFGVAVGTAIAGVPIGPGGMIDVESLGVARPYPALVGLFAVATFAMHGAIYLQLRTDGPLRRRVGRWAWWGFGLFLTLFVVTTAVTVATFSDATANFTRYPWLWVVPALNVLAIANLPRSLSRGSPREAFVSSGAVIAAFTFLFGVALYPNLIVSSLGAEFSLTVEKAASSRETLRNLLIAVGIGMPFVLLYTVITYRVFRKPGHP